MDLKEETKGSTVCPSDPAAAEGGQALPWPGEAGAAAAFLLHSTECHQGGATVQ